MRTAKDRHDNSSFTRVFSKPDTRRDPEWAGNTQRDPHRFVARSNRVSLEELAAYFIHNVENDDDDNGDYRDWIGESRTNTIVAALRSLGLEGVDEILGYGSFGTAAMIDTDEGEIVVKLTSDASEVQAGYVLIDYDLEHVAAVYLSNFVRGVRVNARVDEYDRREPVPVGILYTEKVNALKYDHAAEELSNFVQHFKEEFKVWPHQLRALPPSEERERLNRASRSLAILLHEQASDLRSQRYEEDANLCDDVASGVEELREHGVYGIDVHAGNVGYVGSRFSSRTYKIFDIGSSSAPGRPKAPTIGADGRVEEPMRATLVSEDAPKPTWVGEGTDALEGACGCSAVRSKE